MTLARRKTELTLKISLLLVWDNSLASYFDSILGFSFFSCIGSRTELAYQLLSTPCAKAASEPLTLHCMG